VFVRAYVHRKYIFAGTARHADRIRFILLPVVSRVVSRSSSCPTILLRSNIVYAIIMYIKSFNASPVIIQFPKWEKKNIYTHVYLYNKNQFSVTTCAHTYYNYIYYAHARLHVIDLSLRAWMCIWISCTGHYDNNNINERTHTHARPRARAA
jgi:hypothetical protein